MRELDTQTLESPKTSRAELAKFARQARKLRATFEALPLAARLALASEAARNEHPGQSFDDLLDRRRETLRPWAAEADAARAKLEKSNPGAQQNEPLCWLVGEVAEIWRQYVAAAVGNKGGSTARPAAASGWRNSTIGDSCRGRAG